MTTPDQPQYAPVPKAASGFSVKLADLIVAAGAIVILLFSFAPVVSFPGVDELGGGGPGRSLWSFLSPIGLFVILAAVLLLASAVVDAWWPRHQQLVGVNRHHIQTGLALFVLVDMIGLVFVPHSSDFGGALGTGWGGVIQLLGALIAAAGAILNHFNQMQNPIGMPNISTSKPAAYPPAQGGYAPPQQQGYAPPAPQGYVPPPAPQQGYAPPSPVDPQGPTA